MSGLLWPYAMMGILIFVAALIGSLILSWIFYVIFKRLVVFPLIMLLFSSALYFIGMLFMSQIFFFICLMFLVVIVIKNRINKKNVK